MLPQQAMLLFVSCGCLVSAASAAATAPARVHAARQGGPISIAPASLGPGPVTPPTQSSSTQPKTMSLTPSEPSIPFTPLGSPIPSPSPSPSSSSPSGNTASPSSLSSSGMPQPSSPPTNLNFTVQNMTTCQSSVITWTYSGQDAPLLLSITNIGISQDLERHLKARQDDTDGTFSKQLVDTNTSALNWPWPSVNVSQGWYEIEGLVFATGVNATSSRFFVANGTDVSCLTGVLSPQPSPTPSPASGTSSPSSSSSDNNTSTIAGSVVGAIVGAALLALVATWFWLHRRRRTFVAGARVGRHGERWSSLKSNNSDIGPRGGIGGTIDRIPSHHSQTESMGGMFQGASLGEVSSPTTSGDSHEDVVMMGEEKLVSPTSPPGMNPFEVLNTPVQYDHRTSLQGPTAVADNSRSRATSVRISNQSLEQQAQRIRSSMENSIKRRSERLSMPTLPPSGLSRFPHSPSSAQAPEEYPLSPVTATPANRSISTGAVSTTHRTPRKPVPQYDPSDLREETNADSVSPFTAPADFSHSHGTGSGAGKAANGAPPDLSHNGDGRPVHYLIPDMPLPQEED